MHVDMFHYLVARLNIKNERGAALVEYALLLALIAVVCIVAVKAIGGNANNTFTSVGGSLANP
jgi:pilus assembly protein Flp/PilA